MKTYQGGYGIGKYWLEHGGQIKKEHEKKHVSGVCLHTLKICGA